ncbi:cysteine synthase A [Candidatus Poribacteria bacterium]|nr:cysteine synthase A [Candidatus Poribacteria bacterium]
MRDCRNILNRIGKGPIVELCHVNHTKCSLLAKMENFNPSGSIKDVMALYMISKAESRNEINPGDKIIEVTTGNTGIAFAMISALKGYKFTAVMPEHMSIERRKIMEALGANIMLTPAEEDMKGAVECYKNLVAENPDAWLPNQFGNLDNIDAHRHITGRSILEQINGNIDAFIAGIGTGGTLLGVSRALREWMPDVRIVAVEPEESAVMSGKKPELHDIQGIGEGFIPELVNMDEIDDVITVKSNDAKSFARKLAREEGLFVGVSSGANVLAALKMAERLESESTDGEKKTIVTILPDSGERYLSMNIF